MGPTSPRATGTDAEKPGARSWWREALRLYPGYWLGRLRRVPAPAPLPPGSAGALLLSGMFAHIRVLGPLMEAIRARGVPATGLDLGANVRGTIDQRVSRLREAVAAHAETGGRVVLVAHSMGAFVCARYLVERPPGVSGFISLCGVFGGIRPWTLLGWPIFDVVREMRRETGGRLTPELRRVIEEPSVPTTLFQADKDEFVRDQSAFRNVRSFRTAVTHNGPVIESGAVAAIADQVAEFLARPS